MENEFFSIFLFPTVCSLLVIIYYTNLYVHRIDLYYDKGNYTQSRGHSFVVIR
jgi:hypothetical protein